MIPVGVGWIIYCIGILCGALIVGWIWLAVSL